MPTTCLTSCSIPSFPSAPFRLMFWHPAPPTSPCTVAELPDFQFVVYTHNQCALLSAPGRPVSVSLCKTKISRSPDAATDPRAAHFLVPLGEYLDIHHSGSRFSSHTTILVLTSHAQASRHDSRKLESRLPKFWSQIGGTSSRCLATPAHARISSLFVRHASLLAVATH